MKYVCVDPNFPLQMKYGLETVLHHIGLNFSFNTEDSVIYIKLAQNQDHGSHLLTVDAPFIQPSPKVIGYLSKDNRKKCEDIPFIGTPRSSEGGEPIFWYRQGEDIPAFELKENVLRMNIDLFSAISTILREEFEPANQERRLAKQSFLRALFGNLEDPIVNRYEEFFWEALKIACRIVGFPLIRIKPWPNGRAAACITHDIDYVTSYWRDNLLRCLADLRKHKLTSSANNGLLVILKLTNCLFRTRSPVLTFNAFSRIEPDLQKLDSLIRYDKIFKIPSTFFVMTCGIDGYTPSDPVILKRLNKISCTDCEIALHAHKDLIGKKNLSLQSKEISKDVTGVRYHALAMPLRDDWVHKVFKASGIRYDSSIGYSDEPGFRTGTCRPYRLYNTDVVELPITVMDKAVNPLEEKYDNVSGFMKKVGSFQGVFVALFHHNYFEKEKKSYMKTIRSLKDNNFWIAPCCEVAERWSKITRIKLQFNTQSGTFTLESRDYISDVTLQKIDNREKERTLTIKGEMEIC